MGFSKKILGFLHLMRPLEWTKSFGNMVVAVVLAGFMFNVLINVFLFAIAFVSVAILWSGLYALNDFTDWQSDKKHYVKNNRPIPSGSVKPKEALVFSLVLILISFTIGFFISVLTFNYLFLICLGGMLLNQLLYTIKPFNFKKRPVLDLFSGSLVNPFFRFYAGWVLFVPAFNAPILAILFILGLQLGGFGLYRLSSKSLEQKLGYKSSVTLFGEKNIKRLCYFMILLGCASFFLMFLNNNIFFPRIDEIGWLPFRYVWLAILSMLAFPLYKNALSNPEQIDVRRMYKVIYIHYFLFIIGFIVLYAFF